MKTTKAKPTKRKAKISQPDFELHEAENVKDEEVAVIVDVRTGAEYYMFPIDFFSIEKRDYAVMTPYDPERSKKKEAEIVILRSQISKTNDQLYISIRNKKELKKAFNVFFQRFEKAT